MGSMKLFVLVFALFFWDGRALRCAYQQQSEQFCRHVNESYQLNNSTEHLLDSYTFRDAKERVLDTEQKILDVLKLSEKSALTPALCTALDSEINAVFSLRVGCGGSQKMKDPCNLDRNCLSLYLLFSSGMDRHWNAHTRKKVRNSADA
ncbi:hypothetical protein Q1695_003810 [Nippostrongylus brasiliensis]|nr:hypothetical protein Q1695_003810 [Nippostrongylus brasiliensis]